MKILLVDDSRTVLALYGGLLRRAGHEVLTAVSAPEALRTARRERPPLAIVDYHLIESSGDRLVADLLRDRRRLNITVVMFSGSPDALRPALEAGAIDLISKTEPPEIVLKRIEAIARTVEAQQELPRQLTQALQAVTETLGVGALLAEDGEVYPVNPLAAAYVDALGGGRRLAGSTGQGWLQGDDGAWYHVQRIALDPDQALLLLRRREGPRPVAAQPRR